MYTALDLNKDRGNFLGRNAERITGIPLDVPDSTGDPYAVLLEEQFCYLCSALDEVMGLGFHFKIYFICVDIYFFSLLLACFILF